ncbi:hypothetical protein [Bacteriovorax sp. DB6_IX]|uniref:hypothetical protein n=1 Tax=Bacteriovorax sp. DB6_IX TaxID=1353530 RepID=UPI0005500B98|nr:hypothetical protein [Bacteriovorax sp. DB6_IX]
MNTELKTHWRREYYILRRHLIDGLITFVHFFYLSFRLLAQGSYKMLRVFWGEKLSTRPEIADPTSEGHIREEIFIDGLTKGPKKVP